MPVRSKIPFNKGTFFITFTCINWIPLIEITNSYNLIYKWFEHLTRLGHTVNAYVIMPNHIHVIITFNGEENKINILIGEGKRFIAYKLILKLHSQKQVSILNKLKEKLSESDINKGKKHDVFEPSFDWKHIDTMEFYIQKLNYVHQNPCKGKNPLVNKPEDYLHSSYRSFYKLGDCPFDVCNEVVL
jgi:hypothetical protein